MTAVHKETKRPRPTGIVRATTGGAALLVLVAGYVHLCLYRHGYRYIPKIGVGFLLQATLSLVIGVALAVAAWRPRSQQAPKRGASLARLAALGLALGSLAAFTASRTGDGLFGFNERGFDPAPKAAVAFFAEVAVVVVLAACFVAERARHSDRRRAMAPAERVAVRSGA